VPTLTPEQLEMRRTGIGSSEIGIIAGLSLYATPMAVWLEKRGILERGPQTPEQEWGHELEDVIARRYARENDGYLVDGETVVHQTRSWMLATPDRWFVPRVVMTRWLLECKNVGLRQFRYWGPAGTDEAPPVVIGQASWQMAVTGTERCDVAALLGGSDYRTFELHRDLELEAGLIDIGERFWFGNVVADIPPPLDASDETKKWLASRFPRDIKPLLEATAEARAMAGHLRTAERFIGTAERRAETIRAQLKEQIGEASGITGDFGTITWKANKKGIRSFRPTWAEEKDNGNTADAARTAGTEGAGHAEGAPRGLQEVDAGRASDVPDAGAHDQGRAHRNIA
jgi:putative phage-type endonuclease